MNKEKLYKIRANGTAPELYPTETFFCVLWFDDDDGIEVPKRYPFNEGWGTSHDISISTRESYPMPKKLDMVWLSIIEKKFYSLEQELPTLIMEEFFTKSEYNIESILVGMAPYGRIALWFNGEKKTILIGTFTGSQIDVPMSRFLPANPDYSLEKYCDNYINSDNTVKKNCEENGLPADNLFINCMQQFIYRYFIDFSNWTEDKEWTKLEEDGTVPEFNYIEEALFDGTHDKLHDGGLLNYHEAGKPKKLAVQWHIKKSEYTAYFWFEEKETRAVFARFYGAHPDTKTDFMIRIDSEKNKYELALYRYGLKEPQVISESAYQLIVFKNKFEYFRSENYNQERGAWIW